MSRSLVPTEDFIFETPGAGGFTEWQELPEATWWHVVQATEPVTIQWNNKQLPPITRLRGNVGETPQGVKRVRLATATAQTVIFSMGDSREFDFGQDVPQGPIGDLVKGVTHLSSLQTFSVATQGYGTAILDLAVPANGSSILGDINNNSIPWRYLDGRFGGNGILPPGLTGKIVLDLAGFGGFTLEYFGPDNLTFSYIVSTPTHPLTVERQMVESVDLVVGGTPYLGGAEVTTARFKNNANKCVTIRGQFNGGTPGTQVLVAIVPVDQAGNVYPGRPTYFAVTLNPGSPEFFARFGMDDINNYFDIYGVGVSAFLGVAPLPVGSSDYAIVLWNPGGAAAWGLNRFEVISARGGA